MELLKIKELDNNKLPIKEEIFNGSNMVKENFVIKEIRDLIVKIQSGKLEKFTEGAQSTVFKANINNEKEVIILKYNFGNGDKEYEILKYVYNMFNKEGKVFTPKPIEYVKLYNSEKNKDDCFLVMDYIKGPTFYQYYIINIINFLVDNFKDELDMDLLEYNEDIKDIDLENNLEKVLNILNKKNKKIKKLNISDNTISSFKNIQDKVTHINKLWANIKNLGNVDKNFSKNIKGIHSQMKEYLDLQKKYGISHNDLNKNYRNFIWHDNKLRILDYGLSTMYNPNTDYSSSDFKILSELSNISS